MQPITEHDPKIQRNISYKVQEAYFCLPNVCIFLEDFA